MQRRIQALCIACVIFIFAALTCAQETSSTPKPSPGNSTNRSATSLAGLDENLRPDPTEASASSKAIKSPPSAPPLWVEDQTTKAAYLSALRAYYDYQRKGLEHRTNVFAWQLFSTRIIFFTVITLVLSGVYFSGVQFHSSLRANRIVNNLNRARLKNTSRNLTLEDTSNKSTEPAKVEAGHGNAETPVEPRVVEFPVTELDASLKGIKVSSPVLGVIILALSFLFFYLYLKFAYEIREIF